MRKIKNLLLEGFTDFYVFIFGRISMQKYNKQILLATLRARGYDNYQNYKISGELNFIKILTKYNPTLCLDIGANNGNYTKMLLEFTDSKVISFEPLPKAFSNLSNLINFYSNRLETFNLGIADKKGELDLFFGDSESEHASFSIDINKIDYVEKINKNKLNVAVTSIDLFVVENKINKIDFIKIDTEGFEFEVLIGAKNTIKNLKPKFIQIEMNYHQLFRNQTLYSISQLLDSYKMYQLLPYGTGIVERMPEKQDSNFYYFSNFIFVHKELDFNC
jgi:FkbM family methyltransferase